MASAGRFKHRVVIIRPVKTENQYGEEIISGWEEHGQSVAKIRPLSSREFYEARQRESEVTHELEFRRTPMIASITSEMLIVKGSRSFEIEGTPINVNEANKIIRMTVTEK